MVAAGLASLFLWRRRRLGSARAGFMRKALGVITALTASLLLVVVVAAVFAAREPAGALLALLGMG